MTFAPTRDFSGDRMVVLGPETAALNPFRSDRQAKPAAGAPRWTIRTTDKGVTLNTAKLQVLVDRDGTVTFADQAGRTFWRKPPAADAWCPRRCRAPTPTTFSRSGSRIRTSPSTASVSARKAS